MQVHAIHTGNFKLDGGAMFGVVPKTLWQKWVPADDNNMCNWAMRCLLVIDGEKKILIDTGIGNKQSEKFFGYYGLNGDGNLQGSLFDLGIAFGDITDVILTHLHFDHCGGAVYRDTQGVLRPTFPNAVYHTTESHWNHALNPNDRERPSFLQENFIPLQELGLINFVSEGDYIGNRIEVKVFNGHTLGMIAPLIHGDGFDMMYMADLIPAAAHVPVNYVIGYDIQPLVTMDEKKSLLPWLASNLVWLVYEHDAQYTCSQVEQNEKGQFRAINQTNHWPFNESISYPKT